MNIVKIENLKELIIEIRGQSILLDSDVAELYGVETKRINEAVKNNLDKFPEDYMFELQKEELDALRSKFSTAKLSNDKSNAESLHRKRLVYDGHDIEEQASHRSNVRHHRDFLKD